MTFALVPPFLRKSPQVEPEVWLGELQEQAREAEPPADSGWVDAPPGKRGVITLRLPGLPDDDGRVQWTDHDVAYSRGRNLAGYLRELGVDSEHVLHVICDGRIFRRADIVRVFLPETRFARIWRKVRRLDPPTIELGAFEAFIPRDGSVISIIPTVDGKNASTILGIVGGIVGGVVGFYTGWAGGGPGWGGALRGAFVGYQIGAGIGALLTPTPNINRGTDGPSSYVWGGITNDDRAGVPEEILLGQRLVAGGRISAFRRRGYYIPPNRDTPDPVQPETPTQDGPTAPVDQAVYTANEKLYLLIRIAGHATQGPVGTVDPNLPADITTNPPDVRINNQHYSNFPGVQVSWRNGSTPQSVIPGFDVLANTYDLAGGAGVDVTALGAGVGHVYTTVSDQVDAFEVLLNIAGLSHNTNKGTEDNWTRYRVEYRRNGTGDPWTNVDPSTPGYRELKDHTHALRFETRRVEKLTRAKYDIRVTWIDAQFKDAALDQWHIILSGITEETQQSVTYDGKTILAIEGIATEQLSGNLPNVTAMWRGAIPQKWDGTQFLAADWGVGTAKPAGRNRGWLTLWLIRNHELGCGEELRDADINLNVWKTFAEKCDEDETVTPKVGSPYTEPRFQLDLYINQQQAAVDMVQQLLGSARGALFWSGPKVTAGYDGPSTPAQLFGMGNVVQGSFRTTYRSERAEINTYDVTFENRDANFDTDTVTVCIKRDGTFCTESELQASGEVVKRRSLQLVGSTRLTESVREGRFRLKQSYALRTLSTFGASTDSLMAETYDVINVAHDLPQWGYSGRVMANDNAPPSIIQSMVMFDRTIPFDGVTTYGVIIRYAAPDISGHEVIEERVVADVAAPDDGSSYFGVTVTVPFTYVPQEGDVWAYGPVATKVKPFRILEISRDANVQREISVIEYNASIYVTDGPIEIPIYSDLPDFTAAPGPITNATSYIETKTDTTGSASVKSIVIEWRRPQPTKHVGMFKGAKIEFGYTAIGPWTPLVSADGTMHRWDNPPVGVDLYFRLTPYSTAGKYNFAGAYIITTPVNLASNWSRTITPQNPSGVTFAKDAAPNANRRRVVRSGDNPGQSTPQQVFDLFVNWTFSDVVNPVGTFVGFRVIVYLATGGDPNTPYWSGVAHPLARAIGIPGLEMQAADTYIAAVQALYVDGITSALVTSTGLLLDPATGEPYLQTSDDRNVAAYAETFDTAGVVPTGFTKAAGDTLSVTDSSLQVAIGNLSSTFVQWNLKQWADAYLDVRRGGGGGGVGRGFSVELAFDPRTAGFFIPGSSMLVSFDDGLGSVVTQTVPLITKNEAHIYKVDFSSSVMSTSPSVSPKVTVDLSGAFISFVTWALRGIAVAFDDIAWNVDGHLDRAIRAREQFGKDSLGLGFFLQAPVRLANDIGDVTIVDSNGQQYIRAGGVDTSVLRAFKSLLSRAVNDGFWQFDILADATFSNGGLDPLIPRPRAHNKVRLLIEATDAGSVDVDPTGLGYPIRRYLEATEIGRDGFRFSSRVFYGGTLTAYRDVAPAGGWSATAGRRSAIAVAGTGGHYNFNVQPSPALPGGASYYRNVLLIEAAMPLVRKQNGSFYYVDIGLRCKMGRSNNDNPMTFVGSPRITGPHNLRALTDGNVHRMAIVIAGNNVGLLAHDVLVECTGVGAEAGAGGGATPGSIRLMAVEMAYQNGGYQTNAVLGQNFNVILAEVA